MAWHVDTAFSEFHSAIALPGDHRSVANTRKDWIVRQLSGRLTVIEAFSFGSIPRHTALSGHADVDVLVALHYSQHVKDRKPSAVLSTLKTALGPGAGAVRRNGQAVTVRFQSWPNVDVVPASRVVDGTGKVTSYSIPDMHREQWLTSKPRAHSKRMADAASARGPKFRQVVKMAKDWNRRQPKRLQSYHVEAIALGMSCDWSDYSWAVLQFFRSARDKIAFHWYDDEDVSGYIDWSARTLIDQQLGAAESNARSGWYATNGGTADHRTAITSFKRVFGQRFPSYG